jgi:hypothetical protein
VANPHKSHRQRRQDNERDERMGSGSEGAVRSRKVVVIEKAAGKVESDDGLSQQHSAGLLLNSEGLKGRREHAGLFSGDAVGEFRCVCMSRHFSVGDMQ